MSQLGDVQLEVARLLFALPEADGFALAGGCALLVLGAIDRPTRDIDAFIAAKPEAPPGDVRSLAEALRAALDQQGWTITTDRELMTFARLVAEHGGRSVEIDLAIDSPPLFPVEIVHGLPVLSSRDLAGRKVLAILDRAEGRDFTDLRALAEHHGQEDCVRWARELDDRVRPGDIAAALDNLARLDDDELPCPAEDVAELREWFGRWSAGLGDS